MAAPIYRNEFDQRMQNLVGFIQTAIDSAKFDINANADAKFSLVIKHYDAQIETLKAQIETLKQEMETLKQEMETLKQDGLRRERKLDAVLRALHVNIEEI